MSTNEHPKIRAFYGAMATLHATARERFPRVTPPPPLPPPDDYEEDEPVSVSPMARGLDGDTYGASGTRGPSSSRGA